MIATQTSLSKNDTKNATIQITTLDTLLSSIYQRNTNRDTGQPNEHKIVKEPSAVAI